MCKVLYLHTESVDCVYCYVSRKEDSMKTNTAIDDLRHRSAIYQQAAEYIAENFDDDKEVDYHGNT